MPSQVIRLLLVLSVVTIFFSEALSAFNGLTPFSIQICWIGFAFLMSLYLGVVRPIPSIQSSFIRDIGLVATIIICAVVLTLGTLYPSQSEDHFTYHLPRVLHWLQNHSLNQYPSSVIRQNAFPPVGDLFFLHFVAFGFRDSVSLSIVNFVFGLGALTVVYEMAKSLNLSERAARISVLILALTPTFVVQLFSVRNDLVLTFFYLSTIYFLAIESKFRQFKSLVWSGIASGLAAGTKGTGIFVVSAILLSTLFNSDVAFRNRIKKVIVPICLLLFINSFHYYRNWRTFGHFNGSPAFASGHLVGDLNVETGIVNSIKHLASLFHSSFQPFSDFVYRIASFVIGVIRYDGFSSQTDFNPETPFSLRTLVQEDTIGSPITMILFFWAFFTVLLLRKLRNRETRWLLLQIFATFLSVSTFVRWQLWLPRLYAPFFGLVSIFLASEIDVLPSRLRKPLLISYFLIGCLAVSQIPSFRIYESEYLRPSRNAIDALWSQVKVRAPNCRAFGLETFENQPEGLIWEKLLENGNKFSIQHLAVRNETERIRDFRGANSCAVFVLRSFDPKGYRVRFPNPREPEQKLTYFEAPTTR